MERMQPVVEGTFDREAWEAALNRGLGPVRARRIGINMVENAIEARGEQPDSLALPADGALRGEIPLLKTEGTEV